MPQLARIRYWVADRLEIAFLADLAYVSSGQLMTGHFSPANVQSAIARLPVQSSDEVRRIRTIAEQNGLRDLLDACDAELGRRPFDQVDADMAKAIARAEQETEGMDLTEAVRHAFTRFRPPTDYELRILRWIAANPGGSYADALAAYGKGDLGLCIGHLVYDRYGCFRRFIDDREDQSSVLIDKDRGGGSVRYTLRPEVLGALREVGVV